MFEKIKTHTDQGNLGEAKALYELTKLGFLISKPLIINIKYDLVADDGEKLYRVSVKTTTQEKGAGKYKVNLATSGGTKKRGTKYLFEKSKCDFLFVCASNGGCWLIPSEKINTASSLTVGCNLYKDYYVSGPGLILDERNVDLDPIVIERRSRRRVYKRALSLKKSQELAKPCVKLIEQMEISNLTELKLSIKKIVNCAYPLKWARKHLPELYEKFKGEKIILKIPCNHRTHQFTKEELLDLLWKIPTTQIGLKFGITDKAIEKWVKRWGLSKPPRGYWAKQYAKENNGNHLLES